MNTSSTASLVRVRRTGFGALMLATVLALPLAPAPAAAQSLPDFTELVEKAGPAVVNIRTTERSRNVRRAAPDENDDELRDFFRRFGLPVPDRSTPRNPQPAPDADPQLRGVGSGFILNADGYVMTNAHVVDGAEEVIVTLVDKREFKAKIIGVDKRTDVALIKIEATGLPTVRIGDVTRLKVGEWVIAIGSPFGLESTVTAGIVSAKSRDTGELLPLIQTDVAINPGNSGGPLINMRGEVVGINSQIYSQSGGYMGISFAIPIDEATRVSEQLRAGGRVVRGRIGVVIGEVPREVAEAIGLGKPMGALVRSIEAGGPADKSGIEGGDIITKVDGKAVERSGDLPRVIGSIKPGTKAAVQVFRRGAYRDFSVTVIEFEAERAARKAPDAEKAKPPAPVSPVGLVVSDLTDAQKRDLKLKSGVKVDSAEGAAARAGIHENDIIVTIDNVEITSAKQLDTIVAKADKSRAMTLLVRRGDASTFVTLRQAR